MERLAEMRGIIERDYQTRCTATESSLDQMRRQAPRYRGSVRLSTCRVWTEEAYNERRKRELAIPMP